MRYVLLQLLSLYVFVYPAAVRLGHDPYPRHCLAVLLSPDKAQNACLRLSSCIRSSFLCGRHLRVWHDLMERSPVYTAVQLFHKKMKNASCDSDRLNSWNSILQATWYIRHIRWTCLFYISFIIWCLWTKPTIWLFNTQFHDFYGRSSSRVSYFILMNYYKMSFFWRSAVHPHLSNKKIPNQLLDAEYSIQCSIIQQVKCSNTAVVSYSIVKCSTDCTLLMYPCTAVLLLYCTALYYCTAVLYCTVLCSTVLYCTVLYFTVLYCTVLYLVLYCTVLYCTVLFMYCIVLYCTVLFCYVMCCTVLYCTVPYCRNVRYC